MSLPKATLLSPSLLAADFADFRGGAHRCAEAGASWLHFDVMDGHFVPNLTFGADLLRALRSEFDLPFDTHLMVSRPDDWITLFAEAGANYITIQAEAATHLQRTLAEIRRAGCRAGVALNPATNPDVLRYVLTDLDLVLVMTVNPGFGGQKFLPQAARKVADLAKMRDEAGVSFLISVDGGVDDTTAPQLVANGANVLVAGSFVFKHPDGVAGGIRALRQATSGQAAARTTGA